MTRNRRRLFWPAILVGLLALTALSFAASASLRGLALPDAKSSTSQNGGNSKSVKRAAYVRRSSLSPKLAWNLNALGDRLERTGRERLTVTGTLSRAADSQTEELTAVFEFPERLRLTRQRGTQTRVLIFDGEQTQAAEKSPDTAEQDLIETLFYGSAEHFFATQMQGRATRLLGSRFRIDDGSTADYNGPYYDIYKVADQIKSGDEPRERLKFFYFNSENLLLERVTYEIDRNGSTIKVEERLNEWAKEQGQQVARRIQRFENGESVFVFTVRAAGLSARANDGVFAD